MTLVTRLAARSSLPASLLVVLSLALPAQGLPGGGIDWRYAGNDLQNTRNAAQEHIIGVNNAAYLHVKWAFTAHGGVMATPTTQGGSVYVPDGGGYLHRIDAETGEAIWSINLASLFEIADALIVSRSSPVVVGNKVIFGTVRFCEGPRAEQVCRLPASMAAVDKNTGALLWSTPVDSHPYATLTATPVVFGNRIFVGVSSHEETPASFPDYPCCTFRGSMMALDVNTGAIIWKTHSVPPGYAGGAIWSSTPVVDVRRHSVYFTTGNNYMIPDSVLECVNDNEGDPAAIDACNDPNNWFDAIVAVDPDTGAIKWGARVEGYDNFVGSCLVPFLGAECPSPAGPDYDFGQGVGLFHVDGPRGGRDLIGAGQKSGVYWALDPDNGQLVWSQEVGPGGTLGGMMWGSAVDGSRVYVSENNGPTPPFGIPPAPFYTLPSGEVIDYGSYAALDAATGEIVWQVPNPVAGTNTGPVTVANGVVFACERGPEGHMFAFDAATGELLWDFNSGATCQGGAAVVKGIVYWGSGRGASGNTLYAFSVE